MNLTYEHYLMDLAYTRQVAVELRLRFLLARLRYRWERMAAERRA